MTTHALALYTTFYPAAQPYIPAWYASLRAQTDAAVDVWIGLDGIAGDAVPALVGERFNFTPVKAGAGWTVADLRNAAFTEMAKRYAGVIFTDPDDWMLPGRVAQARADLEVCDASACAMRLVDVTGTDLQLSFTLPLDADPNALMPVGNVFGLSNTAYRSTLLGALLPAPPETVLVDWLLASRAWAGGARLYFNPTPQMAYRQHPHNTARVLPPFTAAQVLTATGLVLQHYHLLLDGEKTPPPALRAQLEIARARVLAFQARIHADPQILQAYTGRLNQMSARHVWWSWVAHPQLDALWMA